MSLEEWKKVKLKDIIIFNPKETIKKGQSSKKVAMDKLEPFTRKITGFEEVKFTSGTKFRNGDTLLARITPCLENGKTAQVDILNKNEVGFGSTEYIVLREKINSTDNDFIYYMSISPEFRNVAIKAMNGSSGRQRVQKDVLENSEFMLPPIVEQRAIAKVLSGLDKKIEINNQINDNLEKMAQAIFKQWFVDFEFPNENGEPYKSSGGEMVESELGMIPTGWQVTKIKEIGEVVAGGTPSTKNVEYYDGDIPWITPKDLSGYQRKFISKGERSITTLGLQKSSAKLMRKGTVLFSSRAPIGYIVIAQNDVSTNQGFKSIVCNEDIINNNYVYYYLKFHKEKIENVASGSTFKEISGTTMKMLDILVPTMELLNKFKEVVKAYDNVLITNYIENDSLIELRDVLLPKLMSGEIDVSKIDV
ncbi:restriction endonuclease subunit S [Clostridium sp. C8]|uniref:restriction endonuclease subunit S n=1 Tax=Clostridium sp. C8 TaxID=1667357 RepID=UPI00062E8028|nr:restriction endonuclease subunit S [Clostridium sp. C8]KLE15978.1 restriction endonuclease subunit S [Clostridium sp. C8]